MENFNFWAVRHSNAIMLFKLYSACIPKLENESLEELEKRKP